MKLIPALVCARYTIWIEANAVMPDKLHGAARVLKELSEDMNSALVNQDKDIGRVTMETIKVDDKIAMNRARLDRIEKSRAW
jgi:hypothetical protein